MGGRYAYVSVHLPEFSDHILVIVDMAEPTRPEVVGKFWLPGMWTGGGETPTWPKGRRYALHHGLVAGNLAYTAWRDGGLAIVDVADPAKPKLVCHRNWDPPFGGGTHSPLPLPDRNLLVVADEANFADCSLGLRYIWVFDVRVPANPVSISTLPVPDEADYCKKGGNFGPHNLWENRPGAFVSSRYIFATLHNAGVRVCDIANPFQPKEIAYFVPRDPERMYDPRPNRPQVVNPAIVSSTRRASCTSPIQMRALTFCNSKAPNSQNQAADSVRHTRRIDSGRLPRHSIREQSRGKRPAIFRGIWGGRHGDHDSTGCGPQH